MRDRKVYHVMPHGKNRWHLRSEDTEKVFGAHDTREEAVVAGKRIAKNHAPSRLVIHKDDGAIQVAYTFG